MTQQSRLDSMIEELHEYKEWLDQEASRVSKALEALDPSSKPPSPRRTAPKQEGPSTGDLVLKLLDENPWLEITAADAVDELRKKGWETESRDPINAMRAALARLAERGELRRVKAGVYGLPDGSVGPGANDGEGAPEASDAVSSESDDSLPF